MLPPYNTGILILYLSNNIQEIGDNAFSNNQYLTEIVIDNISDNLINYPWGANNSDLFWLK